MAVPSIFVVWFIPFNLVVLVGYFVVARRQQTADIWVCWLSEFTGTKLPLTCRKPNLGYFLFLLSSKPSWVRICCSQYMTHLLSSYNYEYQKWNVSTCWKCVTELVHNNGDNISAQNLVLLHLWSDIPHGSWHKLNVKILPFYVKSYRNSYQSFPVL